MTKHLWRRLPGEDLIRRCAISKDKLLLVVIQLLTLRLLLRPCNYGLVKNLTDASAPLRVVAEVNLESISTQESTTTMLYHHR